MAMPRSASAGGSSRRRDALEGAERVAGGEGARGGGDQGVHRDRLARQGRCRRIDFVCAVTARFILYLSSLIVSVTYLAIVGQRCCTSGATATR